MFIYHLVKLGGVSVIDRLYYCKPDWQEFTKPQTLVMKRRQCISSPEQVSVITQHDPLKLENGNNFIHKTKEPVTPSEPCHLVTFETFCGSCS